MATAAKTALETVAYARWNHPDDKVLTSFMTSRLPDDPALVLESTPASLEHQPPACPCVGVGALRFKGDCGEGEARDMNEPVVRGA